MRVRDYIEGIVNYGLSLKRIEFSAMFIEDLDNKNLIIFDTRIATNPSINITKLFSNKKSKRAISPVQKTNYLTIILDIK